MKNNKILLVSVIFVISLVFFAIFFVNRIRYYAGSCDYKTRKISDKIAKCRSLNEVYTFCCYDDQGEVYNCKDREVFNCGEEVSLVVNLDKFDLPDRFYLCERYTKLVESEDFQCFNILSQINETTNEVSLCYNGSLESKKGVYAFNYGIIPKMSGEISFMELYIFNETGRNVKEILSELSNEENMFEVKGEVVCE